MTRHILLVHSNPVPGHEDAYHDWYDEVHLPDVLEVPGYVAAKRFVAAPSIHGELPDHRFLAIYELETDDLPRALTALSKAAKGMQMDSAFDRSTQRTFAFTELSRPGTDHASSALPRLASIDNFRDVAGTGLGYPVPGGRLRRGVLYRSNRLELSADDLAFLDTLAITAVHDLRQDYEIEQHPNSAVAGAVEYHHPVGGLPRDEVEALSSANQMYEAMLETYRLYVANPVCRSAFASLLTTIATTAGPQIFHCAAGKDRTGWSALLVHHIVGIDRRTAIEDYLLTDEYAVTSRQATLDSILSDGGQARVAVYEPAFRCDERYVESALAAADEMYGGLDGYLTLGLGVTQKTMDAIRARLIA